MWLTYAWGIQSVLLEVATLKSDGLVELGLDLDLVLILTLALTTLTTCLTTSFTAGFTASIAASIATILTTTTSASTTPTTLVEELNAITELTGSDRGSQASRKLKAGSSDDRELHVCGVVVC
jgi:hypothetical protein